MRRYSVQAIRNLDLISRNKSTLATPQSIENRLKGKDNKPLVSILPSLIDRHLQKNRNDLDPDYRAKLLGYLYHRQAYSALLRVGPRLLYENEYINAKTRIKNDNGNDNNSNFLRYDWKRFELKYFLFSLIQTGKFKSLDLVVCKLITHFSLTRKSDVIYLINSVLIKMEKYHLETNKQLNPKEIIFKWVKWMNILNGHCEFNNYITNSSILRPFLEFIVRLSKKKEPAFFYEVLDEIRNRQGLHTVSQFSTTLIQLFNHYRRFGMIESIWFYKTNKNLPIVSSDLTSILRTFCHLGKYDLVGSNYMEYPEAHDDNSQFDYCLIAYANLHDWESLQKQFNALFGIGKLPNIQQYGIVMFALARLGELESVEKLYSQLLRRDMLPTYAVLESLLLAHYKVGDYDSCFTHYEFFEKYDVKPSKYTYAIIFKAYRGLNDIEGALRFLKRKTMKKQVEFTESHFATLIQTTSKTTNYVVGKELYQIMQSVYKITPSGKSVAALMDVYIESGLYDESIKLFKSYIANKKDQFIDDNVVPVYNKAILTYININDAHKCEELIEYVINSKLPTDAYFYEVLIKYMVKLQGNFDSAIETIDQLMNHPTITVKPSHFEIIMSAYYKISYYEGIFQLYKKMTQMNIPVNSPILLYLIKSTFKYSINDKEKLSDAIKMLEQIMENAAKGHLNVSIKKLHPSIVAWPMRIISKYSSSKKALELLNKYNELFYGKDNPIINSKLTIMRSLLVLFGEIEQWDDFKFMFDKYLARIEYLNTLPSSTVPNKNFKTLLIGIIPYELRFLIATRQLDQLPKYLEAWQEKGFIWDNDSWNDIILAYFMDPQMIEEGMKLVNDKFIHGFNLIHKIRLLRNENKEDTNIRSNNETRRALPSIMKLKEENPENFIPKLYLTSDVKTRIMQLLDNYLNSTDNKEAKLKEFIDKYGYFMKSYLMNPRTFVKNWEDIEANHEKYFNELRNTRRVLPSMKF
ncbi:Pet309p NDAI_0C06520 [Naumovozyma dairenensis CBS 421]|uniref:Pentacotripeptide-repeat region of PRORP domain-containing protein n=1 Tax=Naumovozyma dairenensis (strain ATCC 10597 / BCRC 20456 / CBS 421 / NBRC 0211 / NRRL Y-12639) TaxID=1071378 RepID=G0W950_NAUDC|nr:hypothetical protein NDAI_0C06520 [Naumovozyma dairenensis CBS 421]CCD24311.1 hypothetical protein NDAI_0C06520 [Naumovozyma dairenensis CBS 421]